MVLGTYAYPLGEPFAQTKLISTLGGWGGVGVLRDPPIPPLDEAIFIHETFYVKDSFKVARTSSSNC